MHQQHVIVKLANKNIHRRKIQQRLNLLILNKLRTTC